MYKSIRVFIKKNGKCYNTYRFSRSKIGVVGFFNQHLNDKSSKWTDTDKSVEILGKNTEIHFTYLIDGDLHYTTKSKNSIEHVHFDRIKQRKNGEKEISIQRTPDNTPGFAHLLPYFKHEPLENISYFAFPTTGISTSKDSFLDKITPRKYEPKKPKRKCKDFIIPIDNFPPGTLNISCRLLGRDKNKASIPKNTIFGYRNMDSSPDIEIFVTFTLDN